MRFTNLATAVASIALGSTLTFAADKPADKAVKPTATTNKPAEKGAQGGIILQNQGAAKAPSAASKTATPKATGGTQ